MAANSNVPAPYQGRDLAECALCRHPDRVDIDRLLGLRQIKFEDAAERWGVSFLAVCYHYQTHISKSMAMAYRIRREMEDVQLFETVKAGIARTNMAVEACEERIANLGTMTYDYDKDVLATLTQACEVQRKQVETAANLLLMAQMRTSQSARLPAVDDARDEVRSLVAERIAPHLQADIVEFLAPALNGVGERVAEILAAPLMGRIAERLMGDAG